MAAIYINFFFALGGFKDGVHPGTKLPFSDVHHAFSET
jgi:hypothetical protein